MYVSCEYIYNPKHVYTGQHWDAGRKSVNQKKQRQKHWFARTSSFVSASFVPGWVTYILLTHTHTHTHTQARFLSHTQTQTYTFTYTCIYTYVYLYKEHGRCMLMRETQSQWGAEALEMWTLARGTQRVTQRGTWILAQRTLPDPQRGVMAVVMAVDA
jgi:hypothetical protein